MRTATRRPYFATLLAGAVLVAGTGCESSTDPTVDESFVGNWNSTSVLLGGIEQMAPGSSFHISVGFFEDSSYQLIVGGDTSGLFCDGPASCQSQGDYQYTSSRITFDPGTPDALSMQYAVSGTVLTLSGSVEGTSMTARLDRR